MCSKYIRDVPVEDDKIMALFDVTSLYTNISVYDTLNIIKNYVKNGDQSTGKIILAQEKFLDFMVLTTI